MEIVFSSIRFQVVGGEQEDESVLLFLFPELNVICPTRGGSEEEREDLLNQGLVDYGGSFLGDEAEEAPPAEKVVDSTVERDLTLLLSALADHARTLKNEESSLPQGPRTTTIAGGQQSTASSTDDPACSFQENATGSMNCRVAGSSALQFMDPVAYYNSLHQNAHLDPIASAKRGGTGEICWGNRIQPSPN